MDREQVRDGRAVMGPWEINNYYNYPGVGYVSM